MSTILRFKHILTDKLQGEQEELKTDCGNHQDTDNELLVTQELDRLTRLTKPYRISSDPNILITTPILSKAKVHPGKEPEPEFQDNSVAFNQD